MGSPVDPPQHKGSRIHVKNVLWLRSQKEEQIPLILKGALTGLRKEALEKEVVIFLRSLCSIFKLKLNFSTVAWVKSSSPSGIGEQAKGGAHTHLHVSQIWNGHNSHFRDVTPIKSTERKLQTYHTLYYKRMFVIKGTEKYNNRHKTELFLEGKL